MRRFGCSQKDCYQIIIIIIIIIITIINVFNINC